MAWVAICERLRTGMGRNESKTYINVVTSTRQLSPATSAADFMRLNPTHPWADPTFNEFIVDLTDQEASDINDGTNPLISGTQNNPRWQQRNAHARIINASTAVSFVASTKKIVGTGLFGGAVSGDTLAVSGSVNTKVFTVTAATANDVTVSETVVDESVGPAITINVVENKELGSWIDPEDDGTAWTTTAIPDNRFIIRLYQEAATTTHIASEEFDEGAAGATIERFIKLFDETDTLVSTNAGNQRTEIGGKLIDFDFGSSDGLSAGVARIKFGIDVAGRGEWHSNHRYRLVGPFSETSYVWQVFGKVLRIFAE